MSLRKDARLYILNSKWYVDVRVFKNKTELKAFAKSYWPKEIWGWDFQALFLHIPRKHWHKGTVCLLPDTTDSVVVHELYHAAACLARKVNKHFAFQSKPNLKTSKKTMQYYEVDNRLEEFSAAVIESFYEQLTT